MKVTGILAALLLMAAISSCGGENNNDAPAAVETETPAPSNEVKLIISAIVKKDDAFQLFYTQPAEEGKSTYTDIKGSDQPQDIVFTIPKDVASGYFRLDFGTNKEQSEIVVNGFKMTYGDKMFEAKGAQFFDYFIVDETSMKLDKAKSTVTPTVNAAGNYDPITNTAEGLNGEYVKLVN